MTGAVPTFGQSSKEGAELAIQEWNDKGGLLGKKIEWVIGDSQCDAKAATDAANKVIDQDKVKFIIGEVCSSASIPVSVIANQKKVLQISPTSTNPKVTVNEDGTVKPFTFRACFLDPFQGDVMAGIAMTDLKAKTAAVMYDKGNDYVLGLAGYFKDPFEKKGGKVVVYEAYTADDTDFSAILSKVADAKPDVLFLPDYYPKVNLIAKQAKEKGIKAVLLGGDGWDSADLDVQAVDGGYHSNHYAPSDPRPAVQGFLSTYKAKYGKEPDALAVLAYDAANILFESIKKANTNDTEKVRAAMSAIQVEGISGKITFDKNNNPIKTASLIHITGGKKVFVKFVTP
jgi:branched-chain amino acid transport system substrate-binding protein